MRCEKVVQNRFFFNLSLYFSLIVAQWQMKTSKIPECKKINTMIIQQYDDDTIFFLLLVFTKTLYSS